jgi:hypothetical protein
MSRINVLLINSYYFHTGARIAKWVKKEAAGLMTEVWTLFKRKHLLHLPGFEHPFLDHSASNQVSIQGVASWTSFGSRTWRQNLIK